MKSVALNFDKLSLNSHLITELELTTSSTKFCAMSQNTKILNKLYRSSLKTLIKTYHQFDLIIKF